MFILYDSNIFPGCYINFYVIPKPYCLCVMIIICSVYISIVYRT